MCLFIDLEKHPNLKPIVLDKPMIVYKYGSIYRDKYFRPYYQYSFCYTQYVPTEQIPLRYGCFLDRNHPYRKYAFSVQEGYHAYTSPNQPQYSQISELGKFLIPAGSNVYYGDCEEVVADRIVYLGPYIETKYKKTTFIKKVKHFKYLIKTK